MKPTALIASSLLGLVCSCRNDPPRPPPAPVSAPRAPVDAASGVTVDVSVARPVEVQPGVGIGPVQVGMPRAAVEALGLTQRATSDANVVGYGPYTVRFSETSVDWVEVVLSSRESPRGFVSYGRALPADPTSLQSVTAVFSECAEPEVVEGGTRVSCEGGKVVVSQGSGGGGVSVHVARPLTRATPPGAQGARPSPGR